MLREGLAPYKYSGIRSLKHTVLARVTRYWYVLWNAHQQGICEQSRGIDLVVDTTVWVVVNTKHAIDEDGARGCADAPRCCLYPIARGLMVAMSDSVSAVSTGGCDRQLELVQGGS